MTDQHRRPRSTLSAARLATGVVFAVLATSALAACSSASTPTAAPSSSPSSSSSSSPSGASGSPSGVMTGSPVTPAPSSSSSSSGSGGGSSLQDCRESQLHASIDPRHVSGSSTSGAHADYAIIVDFENTSSTSCLMHGYPGAALVNSSGTQVKQAMRTVRGRLLGPAVGANPEPTVTLRPGEFASAGIEGTNQQEQGAAQAGCDNAYYPKIAVTPPNTATAVTFDQRWPVCFAFTVHPTNIEKNPPSN